MDDAWTSEDNVYMFLGPERIACRACAYERGDEPHLERCSRAALDQDGNAAHVFVRQALVRRVDSGDRPRWAELVEKHPRLTAKMKL